MKKFTKQQIQHTEVTKALNAKLSYPSMKDFKWVIQNNQIKECPVTVQDIEQCHHQGLGQGYHSTQRKEHKVQTFTKKQTSFYHVVTKLDHLLCPEFNPHT
jgi:hypothetical protein